MSWKQPVFSVARRHCCWPLLLLVITACSHGVDIVGKGDVVSASGERDCAKVNEPCFFEIVDAYQETYTAIPGEAHVFSEWRRCPQADGNTCTFNIPVHIVRDYWGKSIDPVQPVFVEAPFGLQQRLERADLNLPFGGAITSSFTLVDKFPNLRFSLALFLTAHPVDGRLVVLEQTGAIHAFVNDPATDSTRVVLDYSSQIESTSEQGLLGMAFDPDFANNGYVYLHYSRLNPRRSVIGRFVWDAQTDLIDPVSEEILLEVNQPGPQHNGGMLAFGPDGYLYLAFGDGEAGTGDAANNGQNKSTLLGALLRIDVSRADPALSYAVPADNPFVGEPGSREEIFAYGLRNPFRFSFDRETGDLWLADVGQNSREEVNLITAGGNYGWRVFEGDLPFDGSANTLPDDAFTPPAFQYDHTEGLAIIGGYVYRGSLLPSLQGRYLYSDFVTGIVGALSLDGTEVIANDVLVTARRPTSFGEDNNGELYIVTRTQGVYGLEQENSGSGVLPRQLSDTGIFTDLASLSIASGFIEYEVNSPFWSDDTSKRRWFSLPDNTLLDFSEQEAWTWPQGTVTVKHFEIDTVIGVRRLETRIFIHSEQGWQGFTYRWNGSGTEAVLLDDRQFEELEREDSQGQSFTQLYPYPSRSDCLACHNEAAGFVLGAQTAQLNREFDYAGVIDNQLRSLDNISLFSSELRPASRYDKLTDPADTTAELESRARSYLDTNCSVCHRPGGGNSLTLDLRADIALSQSDAVDVVPAGNELGLLDARIIAPGAKERSVLWSRMNRLDEHRMPPLSSNLIDDEAVQLIGQWIDAM